MKKPTRELWLRQRRLAKYRGKKRLKRRRTSSVTSKRNHFIQPGSCIIAPRRFDAIQESCAEVIKFLRAVANTVLNKKMATTLDFRATESFSVVGTILLYAECDRIVNLSDLPKPLLILEPRRRKPREVLKQIGMFDLTGDS